MRLELGEAQDAEQLQRTAEMSRVVASELRDALEAVTDRVDVHIEALCRAADAQLLGDIRVDRLLVRRLACWVEAARPGEPSRDDRPGARVGCHQQVVEGGDLL